MSDTEKTSKGKLPLILGIILSVLFLSLMISFSSTNELLWDSIVTSGQLDFICSNNDSFLYRNDTGWGCGSFNESDFNVTVTNIVSVNLDEDDTLQTVTDRGSTTSNGIIIPNLTVSEDSSTIYFEYVDPPNVENTTLTSSTTGGTIGAGNWYISLTYADDEGYETQFADRLAVTTTGSTSSITINNLPVSPNPTVTKRVVYMSTSSIFQVKQVEIPNNVDTSYTITAYSGASGNDQFRGRYGYPSVGVGNTMGAKFKNSDGDDLFSVSEEGQFLMSGERAGFIFPLKNTAQFNPYPFYLLRTETVETNNYGFASMFYDLNDGSALKLGHFGRGGYGAAPVELHSDQTGVEFFLTLQRGGAGWMRLVDGGTSVGNVDLVKYDNTVWSSTGGTNTLLRMEGSSVQSNGAGFILFDVDFDDSGFTGSGSQDLINFKINSASKFSVDTSGDVKANSLLLNSHTTFSSDGSNGIINTTTGNLQVYNETGWGTIEAHDFVTHSFEETSNNPLELFTGVNSSESKCGLYTDVVDYSRPVTKKQVIKLLNVTSPDAAEKELLFTYKNETEKDEILSNLDTNYEWYYSEFTRVKDVVTYPYTKKVKGTSEGCMNELQFATLKQINNNLNLYQNVTEFDTSIMAENIYTQSKTIDIDAEYATRFLDTDLLSEKQTHKNKQTIQLPTKNEDVLNVEDRIVDLEGAFSDHMNCMALNSKYSDYRSCMLDTNAKIKMK